MTHKFLILGEDPPTCSLCQNPLSMKHVLLDCAGLNPVRNLMRLTLLKRFLTVKPNTVLEILALINC